MTDICFSCYSPRPHWADIFAVDRHGELASHTHSRHPLQDVSGAENKSHDDAEARQHTSVCPASDNAVKDRCKMFFRFCYSIRYKEEFRNSVNSEAATHFRTKFREFRAMVAQNSEKRVKETLFLATGYRALQNMKMEIVKQKQVSQSSFRSQQAVTTAVANTSTSSSSSSHTRQPLQQLPHTHTHTHTHNSSSSSTSSSSARVSTSTTTLARSPLSSLLVNNNTLNRLSNGSSLSAATSMPATSTVRPNSHNTNSHQSQTQSNVTNGQCNYQSVSSSSSSSSSNTTSLYSSRRLQPLSTSSSSSSSPDLQNLTSGLDESAFDFVWVV